MITVRYGVLLYQHCTAVVRHEQCLNFGANVNVNDFQESMSIPNVNVDQLSLTIVNVNDNVNVLIFLNVNVNVLRFVNDY